MWVATHLLWLVLVIHHSLLVAVRFYPDQSVAHVTLHVGTSACPNIIIFFSLLSWFCLLGVIYSLLERRQATANIYIKNAVMTRSFHKLDRLPKNSFASFKTSDSNKCCIISDSSHRFFIEMSDLGQTVSEYCCHDNVLSYRPYRVTVLVTSCSLLARPAKNYLSVSIIWQKIS